MARPRSGHRSCHEEIVISIHRPPAHAPSIAEAGAWAEALVHHQQLHAAVPVPTGQWLVQQSPDAPVQVLADATAMVEVAAEIQHRIRTTRNETR
ncbi:hypothetical protein ACN2WE_31090 [Streptomyces sp. cg28]|uniref:hypothetical protein n=1 Tax=Streptomyces sp. cg28 TaxID=3403457 RepID=UPI003B220E9E